MAGRRTWRTRAIVLDRTKLGESDLILRLLSQEGTQLSAVAKGARKPGGKLAARSELFSELDLLLAEGRSLHVVSEATLLNAHTQLRGELERVAAASAICEVSGLTALPDFVDSYLMPLCSRSLTACEEAPDRSLLDVVVAAHIFKALAHGGWRPELEGCCACGDPAISVFAPVAGGVLCSSCAKEVPGVEPLPEHAAAWLYALIGCTFDELLLQQVDPGLSGWLLSMAHSWASTHLDSRLRAVEFLLQTP